MKKIALVLLSVIFVLVTGSIHYISADDSTDSEDTSMGKSDVATLTTSDDGKYKMHVQVAVRNAQGQLTAVTEGTFGAYLEHEVTDKHFDNLFGEKEIVTVNDVKYEKVEFGQSFEGKHYADLWVGTGGLWLVQVCGGPNSEFLGVDCAYIFEIRTNQVVIEPDDVIYTNWNVLRAMN
jgi:hypothetical protein|tara:strand:+ start:821 stop:1354 length:534 start_codon:yes stop_codon:yes gene_type:complete